MKLKLQKIKCFLMGHKWIKYSAPYNKWWAVCLTCGEKKEVIMSWHGDKREW